MKALIILITLIAILVAVMGWLALRPAEPSPEYVKQNNMKLTSPAFEHNGSIPSQYSCDGDDVSLPLAIAEVPEQAQGLVLIVDDPDAPAGDWVHWLLLNIDPKTTLIEEKTVPPGAIEAKTSFGGTSYGGPCPPGGRHYYHFKIYALDIRLELDASADKVAVEAAMASHVLDWTELVGSYERQ